MMGIEFDMLQSDMMYENGRMTMTVAIKLKSVSGDARRFEVVPWSGVASLPDGRVSCWTNGRGWMLSERPAARPLTTPAPGTAPVSLSRAGCMQAPPGRAFRPPERTQRTIQQRDGRRASMIGNVAGL